MVKRMRAVRRKMNELSRRKREEQPWRPSVEDIVKREGELGYQRNYAVNEELIEADKTGAAMPDIVKTLEGRR